MTHLTLAGIKVPVDVERFVTPDMQDVLAFYPEWREQGGPWSIQGYLSGYCSALEKWERENGREKKDRMERLVQHFGPYQLGKMLEQYGEVSNE